MSLSIPGMDIMLNNNLKLVRTMVDKTHFTYYYSSVLPKAQMYQSRCYGILELHVEKRCRMLASAVVVIQSRYHFEVWTSMIQVPRVLWVMTENVGSILGTEINFWHWIRGFYSVEKSKKVKDKKSEVQTWMKFDFFFSPQGLLTVSVWILTVTIIVSLLPRPPFVHNILLDFE